MKLLNEELNEPACGVNVKRSQMISKEDRVETVMAHQVKKFESRIHAEQ
jgi:hypothetical protein